MPEDTPAPSTPTPAPTHHPKYYLEDGNITFLVGNDLYRVHRYSFVRESVVFRDMLLMPGGSDIAEGLSDDKPIILKVESISFERFLWMFYNEKYNTDHVASAEHWASIIELPAMWQFDTMSELAFKHFVSLPGVPAIDKLVLRRKHGFSHIMALDAYLARCWDLALRYKEVSYEEGEMVGWEACMVIHLGQVQTRNFLNSSKLAATPATARTAVDEVIQQF